MSVRGHKQLELLELIFEGQSSQFFSRLPPLLLRGKKNYADDAPLTMQLLLTWHCFYCHHHSRRSKGSDVIQSPSEPSVPPPPELPPNTKAPWITIPTSTFPQDWSKLINSDSHADVLFHLGSDCYHAHRLVRVRTLSAHT